MSGAYNRIHLRKSAEDLRHPEYSANAGAVAGFEERLDACPLLARLRALGAPRFENVTRAEAREIRGDAT